MERRNAIFFQSRDEWREWLEAHHDQSKGVWFGYYKKDADKPTVTMTDAVEEALCFGWINSRVYSLDEDRYIQRYQPRADDSVWSKLNKDAAERLIAAGRMTAAGLAKIEAAKRTGAWQAAYTSRRADPVPADLAAALAANPTAQANFEKFANIYHNGYVGWVAAAKTDVTRQERIAKVVASAAANTKADYLAPR